MKALKRGIREFTFVGGILAIVLILMFSQFIFGNQEFWIKTDYTLQYIPFYKDFFRLLDSGVVSWSWNFLLGINFYASKAYYLIGDVYAWLCYFVQKWNGNLTFSLFLVTFIKMWISGTGFYYFLRKLKIKKSTSLVFGIFYMLSGWATIFIEQPIFMSFYSFLPFLFLGVERIIQDKKPAFFILAVALLLMSNYYLAWTSCFLLLVYWIIRFIQVHENFDWKQFWIQSFRILCWFLIGVLIAAVVWLPSILHLLSSPRIGNADGVVQYGWLWNWENLLEILQNFVIPVTKFEHLLYRQLWYYFYQLGIYCGLVPLLFSGIFFFLKMEKKEKRTWGAYLLFAFIILISPKIGMLFHFTYSMRYTFITSFAMLVVGAISLDQCRDQIQLFRKPLLLMAFSVIVLIGIMAVTIPVLRGLNLAQYPEIKLYAFVLICLVLILCSAFFIRDRKKSIALILFIGLCELLVQSKVVIFTQTMTNPQELETYLNEQHDAELVNTLKEMDDSFYRIVFDYGLNNRGIYFDIPTVSTYDSTYEYKLRNFLNLLRRYPDVAWDFNLFEGNIIELLNIKYVIASPESDAATWQYYGHSVYQDDEGYTIYQINENPYIACSYSSFFDYDEANALAEDRDNYFVYEIIDLMNQHAILDVEDIDAYNEKYKDSELLQLMPVAYNDTTVYFDFETTTPQFLYMSIPNDAGWKIYDNGQLIEKRLDVHGGFIGIELEAGKHYLEMIYHVPGLKPAKAATLVGLGLFVFVWLAPYLKKRKIKDAK